jgi:homoserine O-acetyltransferase/O-succinyltransferase
VGFVTRLQSGIGTRGDQDHGVVNSGDDERNPPETGIMERELRRVKNARLLLIPASEKTRGHPTTGFAKFWKQQVQELLSTVPRRAM